MSDNMTVKERKPRNEFNEALPQVFNREGLVKKNPNNARATARDFSRIMAKVQRIRENIISHDMCMTIEMPIGDLYLDTAWSRKIAIVTDHEEQPDVIAALLLNGWIVGAE